MQTPLGEVHAVVEDGRVRRLDFGPAQGEPEPAWLMAAIDAYFDGELDALVDLPLELAGSDFHQRVWKALRETKAGEVVSYKDLATAAGNPAAARAAGTACGRNPVWLAVPCHRAIASGGGLGGYGGGLDRKIWLLEHEGVVIPRRR